MPLHTVGSLTAHRHSGCYRYKWVDSLREAVFSHLNHFHECCSNVTTVNITGHLCDKTIILGRTGETVRLPQYIYHLHLKMLLIKMIIFMILFVHIKHMT